MTSPSRRDRYRAAQLCVNCGRVLDRDGSRCLRCLGPRRARYTRLKGQGRCARCYKKPEEGYVYCAACRARAKAAREAKQGG